MDAKPSNGYTRGRQFIRSMNAADMIVLNGIESLGTFTCHITQGQSIVD